MPWWQSVIVKWVTGPSAHEGGDQNVMQEPLVEAVKVLLPLLHIKLGLIKQFVKQLEPEIEASGVGSQRAPKNQSRKASFPELSESERAA